jgi:hypothetical protein
MITFKSSAMILLIAGLFPNTAAAELLGNTLGAVGQTVSAVGNTVTDVLDGDDSSSGSHSTSTTTQSNTSAVASVDANVLGIARVQLCAGLNAPLSCKSGAVPISAPIPNKPTKSPHGTSGGTNVVISTSNNRMAIQPLNGSFNWLVGLNAISSDRIIVGKIHKVSASQNQSIPIVTILLLDGRTIRIENGLGGIDSNGVWFVLSSARLTSRANTNNILLAVMR